MPLTKVEAIREAYARGEGGYSTLAARFGISRSSVRQYVRGVERGGRHRGPCARKVRHPSMEAATTALACLVADRGTDRERGCEVYACAICEGWHLGHSPAPWVDPGPALPAPPSPAPAGQGSRQAHHTP